VLTYAYGFPRIGAKREYKKTIEGFWKGENKEEDVKEGLLRIQEDNIKTYKDNISLFPEGEMSFYDPMLDTAVLCGLYNPKNLMEYYNLCRGNSALEMTKWFNTNYHYLATDFGLIEEPRFYPNCDNAVLVFKKCDFPQFIGPFTFLKLSKGIKKDDFERLFFNLIEVYKEIMLERSQAQIDEPAFVMDLTREEIELIKKGYGMLGDCGCKITLITYYDSVDFMHELLSLPVSALGLDFIRGEMSYNYILEHGFPSDKLLIAGLVDGRNVWTNNISESILKLKSLARKADKILLSNASPLYHLPVSVAAEEKIDKNLKTCLSFAREKLAEIRTIKECFEGGKDIPVFQKLEDYGMDASVRGKIKSLKPGDFVKKVKLADRRKQQNKILNLPLFPATTIGSFPQTPELRKKRAAFLAGLNQQEYKTYIFSEIDRLIKFQEEIGLDVLVHGEFERTDMVEFFADKLAGIATTASGWVISYGTRIYRPPIIFGDISRPAAMTTDEIGYAQSRTKKPVKGMLTGAVTIISWSYCREDVPVSETAYQISLALKDEILDYEKMGIKIVQVDEPAFREKAPLKKRNWKEYFDWAIKSFNLATNTSPNTQIHTHMCYSDFGEIIDYINQMDCDVISIEASRSKGDIIKCFEGVDFKRQIGLGVWDIHSPASPSPGQMFDIVTRALRIISKENFWINPDCGLKTRAWPEVKESLPILMDVTCKLRCKYRDDSRMP